MNINEELNRCLHCVNKPCTKGCPLGNNTPEIIALLKEGKIEEAYQESCKTSVLQSVCGRICPHEEQCEGSCTRRFKETAISIGKIESYLGDYAIENNLPIPKYTTEQKPSKIAIIGGGPCGISCAAELARNGYRPTIFEKHDYLGGILRHGIPPFRLDKTVLDKTLNKIIDLGIDIKLNQELGSNLSLEELTNDYDAIFLSIGCNVANKSKLEGENLEGVYGANELLEYQTHPDYHDKTVAINGCGNVAMDAARTVKSLGAKRVVIVYRRSENEMPATKEEYNLAVNDNIEFLFQTNILKINGSEKVNSIECIKTELVKSETDDRLVPVNIEGTNFNLDIDYLIMALGSKKETVLNKLNESLTKPLEIKEDGTTNYDKVFVGGDFKGEIQTVAYASKSGITGANNIIEYLKNKS